MLLIDSYLQQHNLKRYDVAKQTGISQQVLSNNRSKPALNLPITIIDAIAKCVDKTPGNVLDELIALEKREQIFVAKDYERLFIGLQNQEKQIIVSGPFLDEIRETLKIQTSTPGKEVSETMGFRSMITLVNLIRLGYHKITGKDLDEFTLQENLHNYEIIASNKTEIVLEDRRIHF